MWCPFYRWVNQSSGDKNDLLIKALHIACSGEGCEIQSSFTSAHTLWCQRNRCYFSHFADEDLWPRMVVWLRVRRPQGCRLSQCLLHHHKQPLVPNASVPYHTFHKWPFSLIMLSKLKQRVKYRCPGLLLHFNVWHLKGCSFGNHCLAAENEVLMKSLNSPGPPRCCLASPPLWRAACIP